MLRFQDDSWTKIRFVFEILKTRKIRFSLRTVLEIPQQHDLGGYLGRPDPGQLASRNAYRPRNQRVYAEFQHAGLHRVRRDADRVRQRWRLFRLREEIVGRGRVSGRWQKHEDVSGQPQPDRQLYIR